MWIIGGCPPLIDYTYVTTPAVLPSRNIFERDFFRRAGANGIQSRTRRVARCDQHTVIVHTLLTSEPPNQSESAVYLPAFQISAASVQSLPPFAQTTTDFPVTSCGVG